MRFAISQVLWVAILTIVFLVVDCAAFAVQFAIESGTFTWRDHAVAPGESFVGSDPRESCFKARGFAAGQFAATDALADALVFAALAVVDSARPRD